jgi:hypothetical protein
MTLLEKAKSIVSKKTRRNDISDEQIELALAWLKEDITSTQFTLAMGAKKASMNNLYRVALILREAYYKGFIKIK